MAPNNPFSNELKKRQSQLQIIMGLVSVVSSFFALFKDLDIRVTYILISLGVWILIEGVANRYIRNNWTDPSGNLIPSYPEKKIRNAKRTKYLVRGICALSIVVILTLPYLFQTKCNPTIDRITIYTSRFSPGPQDDFGGPLQAQLATDIRVDTIDTEIFPRYVVLGSNHFSDSVKRIFDSNCRTRGLLIFGNFSFETKRVDCSIFVHMKDLANKRGVLIYIKNPDSINFSIDNQVAVVSKFTIGLLLSRSGKHLEKAETYFREALELNTNKSNKQFVAFTRMCLGNLAFQQGDYHKASHEFIQGISQGVDDAFLYYNLGAAYLALHNRDSAFHAFEMAANLNPKLKAPDEWLAIETWDSGNGILIVKDTTTSLYGLMDLQGKIILKPTYRSISQFNNGLAQYRDRESNLLGFLDQKGEVKIPAQFVSATLFANGISIIESIEKKRGVVDSTGSILLPLEYDKIAPLKAGTLFFASRDGYFGVVDRSNKVIRPFKYNHNDLIVRPTAKSAFPNDYAELLFPNATACSYLINCGGTAKPYSTSYGITSTMEGGTWGLLDIETGAMTECKYDALWDAGFPFVHASLNNTHGLITTRGDVVVPFSDTYTAFEKLKIPGSEIVVAWERPYPKLLTIENNKVSNEIGIGRDSYTAVYYAGQNRLVAMTSRGAVLLDLNGKKIASTECKDIILFNNDGFSPCVIGLTIRPIDVNGKFIRK